MTIDVHTEHCCFWHGCKYAEENCTVTNKTLPQSYPCEYCESDANEIRAREYLESPGYFDYLRRVGLI